MQAPDRIATRYANRVARLASRGARGVRLSEVGEIVTQMGQEIARHAAAAVGRKLRTRLNPQDISLQFEIANWEAQTISRMYGRFITLMGDLQTPGADTRLALTKARVQIAFVARDSTYTLNGDLSRILYENAGVEQYQWITQLDERVRPTHASKHGRIFFWTEPPADTGHPGHDWNCRCIADPVVD